jgi:hypothetical protein
VRVGGVLFVVLGLFVLAAGAVYGLWGAEFSSPELAGTFYLTVLGVAFMYLAHVLLAAARAEPRNTEDELPASETGEGAPHGGPALSREALEAVPVNGHASAPALTPFLFALAGTLIVTGLVFTHWLVIAGTLVLAGVAIAWFLETGPRRAAEHAAAAAHGDGDAGPHGDDHTPAGGA